MCGELKLENIKKKKPLLNKAIIQQRLLNYPIKYNNIPERYYLKNLLDIKDNSSRNYKRPSRLKTFTDCSSLLNAITNDLDYSLR
jgi:hypothetical protein